MSDANQYFNLSLAASELKQPLHVKVRQLLRERILNDFQHGQRFYSERGLMQKLNVSQSTVRRALTDLVDEGYLLSDPRRGLFVRRVADGRYVGLISPSGSGSRLAMAHSDAAVICRERNFSLNTYGFNKTDTAELIVKQLRYKPSEERILLTGLTVELALKLDLALKLAGYRHVMLGSDIPGFSSGLVSLDHETEVEMILDYLLKLGHRRIAFMINEPKILLTTNQRMEKIQRKLKERGLVEAQLVSCDTPNWSDSFEAAYRKTHTLMQGENRPTAIVPLSGVGSWAVLRYAVEHHIKVPQQLSIISYDAMSHAELLPVPMTEMTFSAEERVSTALDILWSEPASTRHAFVAPQLIVRASTGPAPKSLPSRHPERGAESAQSQDPQNID
ncbi:MAG: GntR family transcriptional regulator [Verrucomicrobiales bacterium]|jgi:LacI family transcriptional regulator|nr:GntR family transcriptional regulator [Verrucomicrobiales bacterium]